MTTGPAGDATARALAVLVARLVLGLMFVQGAWWRIFDLGPTEHARRFFVDPYADSLLPEWSLWLAGTAVPFVELVGGTLVLVGFGRWLGPTLLGGVLVLVTFGHFLAEPLFSIQGHIFPRLVLVLFLLVVPGAWDRFGLDGWRERRATPRSSPG